LGEGGSGKADDKGLVELGGENGLMKGNPAGINGFGHVPGEVQSGFFLVFACFAALVLEGEGATEGPEGLFVDCSMGGHVP
jgi:hypothetical protein